MKKFLFLLFSTVFGLNAQQKQFKHQFDNFLQLHNKHYENKEYSQKLENFNHNLNLIQENNKDYDNCRLYLSKHSTDGKGKDFIFNSCAGDKKNLRIQKDNKNKIEL